MRKALVLCNIKKLRRRKAWSLGDLTKRFQRERNRAEFAEDFEYVKRAEEGEDIPIEDVRALAKALGVSMSDLYSLIR